MYISYVYMHALGSYKNPRSKIEIYLYRTRFDEVKPRQPSSSSSEPFTHNHFHVIHSQFTQPSNTDLKIE